MKKVIGVCRYSVVTFENKKDWVVGNSAKDWESYKKNILDDSKLKNSLSLFSEVTLPSIAGNSISPEKEWFKLVVLISKDMPEERYYELLEVTKSYEWCKVVPLTEKQTIKDAGDAEVLSFIDSKEEVYATFRIDDDDALSKYYFEGLIPYIHEKFINHAVSFPDGINGLYSNEDENYSLLKSVRHYYIGLGLALISNANEDNKHILYKKTHLDIDKRHPTIIVPTKKPMFLRSFHAGSDLASKNKNRLNNFSTKGLEKKVPFSVLDKHFTLNIGKSRPLSLDTKPRVRDSLPDKQVVDVSNAKAADISADALAVSVEYAHKLELLLSPWERLNDGLKKIWYYKATTLVLEYVSMLGVRYAFDIIFHSGSVRLQITARDDTSWYSIMKSCGYYARRVKGSARSLQCVEWNTIDLEEIARDIIAYVQHTNGTLNYQPTISSRSIASYWWDMKKNFGDLIGPWILEELTARPVHNTIGQPSSDSAIMTVGSLITGMQRSGMTIWGTGLIAPLSASTIKRLKARKPEAILAVRGKCTRKQLMDELDWDVPEVYGDPALLMPYFFQPSLKRPPERPGLSVIPHYSHKRLLTRDHIKQFGGYPIEVQRQAEEVITEIALSDVVISTSLHGLILAQAYEVPWVWLRIIDKDLIGDEFKFEDFFTVLKRDQVAVVEVTTNDLKELDLAEVARKAKVPKGYFDPLRLVEALPFQVSEDMIGRFRNKSS